MKYFRTLREENDGQGGDLPGGEGTVQPSWYYQTPNEETETAGVAGQGETPPEWFNVSKYKSVEEQAKGYNELSKRFGGFETNPEAYELPEGIDVDTLDEGMVDIVKSIGMENHMSQNMFNDLVSRVNDYQQGQIEGGKAAAMEALGENAEARINNVNNWLNTNAPKEMIDIIAPMGTSAESIQAMEWFIEKSKGTTVANEHVTSPAKMSDSEFAAELMAKDSHGNLKISVDPQYKKKMDELTASRM